MVTRELTDEQIALAENIGLNVFVQPAIEIHFRNDWLSVQTAIQKAERPVFVFTSRNGAKAFQRFLMAGVEVPPGSKFYAVGKKTAEEFHETGITPIVPDEQYGAELAKLIISDLDNSEKENTTILHFCGDKRREELRQILSQADLHVKDIVVYETRLKHVTLPAEKPDAILFYSPSAVQSFRNSGGFESGSLPGLFAIGNTTAEELSIASGKHVYVSPEPSTEIFLKFTADILNEKASNDR
ncbi:MAG: uroporphyrinogen-III synthase [Balneolaceae bacterium]